jgi:hypothetical protein
MSKRELIELLKRLLQAVVEEEAPKPRPAPARTPEPVTVTEAELARGFVPHGEPRRWTVDARRILDRRG